MARIKNGILGPIVGRIANVIGYIRLGEAVIREEAPLSTKPRSNAQKAVNERFKAVMEFISPINEFINVSYKPSVKGTTRIPQNTAVSYNNKHAVKGAYPNLEMDYPNAMVSEGSLPGVKNPTVKLVGKSLKFKWDLDPGWNHILKRDQIMMVAYLPSNKNAYYCLSGARRSTGEDELELRLRTRKTQNHLKDTSIETYIAFISDDRKKVSNSIYVGRIAL